VELQGRTKYWTFAAVLYCDDVNQLAVRTGEGVSSFPGERIKLHNEELNDLYSSPNIVRVIKSRRMRWAGHVVRKGRRLKNVYRVLVGKPEGKRPLGRLRRRWEDNIKM
jgi:hypothetical protein